MGYSINIMSLNYTYGNDIKSTDALISKQVATCLNIKWEFILYSKKK